MTESPLKTIRNASMIVLDPKMDGIVVDQLE